MTYACTCALLCLLLFVMNLIIQHYFQIFGKAIDRMSDSLDPRLTCIKAFCLHTSETQTGDSTHKLEERVHADNTTNKADSKYSRISTSRTRISRILRNSKHLSESNIRFDCFL